MLGAGRSELARSCEAAAAQTNNKTKKKEAAVAGGLFAIGRNASSEA
jgi:hypothetical protein